MHNIYPTCCKVTLLIVTVSILTGSTLLTACQNYLTDEPKSQITHEQAYGTVADIRNNALLSIYNYIGGNVDGAGLQGTSRGVYDLNSITTDEQIVPVRGSDWYDGGLWYRLFYHQWTPGEEPIGNAWNYLYKVVIQCNEGIEHIDAYQTTDLVERAELNIYKSEIRAIRAMFYFYIMDLFGRAPLVTSTSVKSSEMTLSNRSELFNWIYNEFNEVLPLLRQEYSQFSKTNYYGRMTAYVAYFVMMKMALNAEIYTDDNWTDQDYPDGKSIQLITCDCLESTLLKANAWETVIAIHDILKAYFELNPDYSNNFDVANEASYENIFVIPMNPVLYANKYDYFVRSRHYCHGAALGGTGENGPCATVSTIKAFGYDETDKSHVDARLYSNFYYDSVYVNNLAVYEDDGITHLVYHPLAVTSFDLMAEQYTTTAGARIAKYSSDATARNDGRLGNNDIVLFRYADALLMYAEASYRLGDTAAALAAINKVYQRSNGDQTKITSINDDVLLTERLKEFVWEGWRRNDLIRFHRFHLPYDLKTNCTYEADAHTTVFPIPSNMMAMHPSWKQNYGYN